jgi:hypothetical protein
VGFLDTLLGRTKPVQPKLDDLFGLPSAAIQLQAATGFTPTGSGSVCFRAVAGKTFDDVQKEVRDLLDMDSGKPGGGLPVEVSRDSYGFTWLVSNHMSDEMDGLVTDLHAVNSSLVDAGYLYKRGTFYPFAPLDGRQDRRDNALELQVKGVVAEDLKMEPDLSKWMAIWGAPGL